MTKKSINRRSMLVLACAVAVAGVSAPTLAKHNKPAPQETAFVPSNIGLSPGYFNGRDSSGTKIRAQVKRSGRDFRVQSLKGKNGPERLYMDTGNNIYKAKNGYSITVTSPRSFYWHGPHGDLTMND